MSELQTSRIVLRRFQLTDLNNMICLESDADVVKYTPYRIPQSKDKTEERLQALVKKEKSSLGVWAAELKGTKEFIGWFMLIETEFKNPEIGFMLVKKHWRKGFATEIVRALVDYGTKTLKYEKVMAVSDENNTASISVLKKIGFQEVGSKIKFDKILNKDMKALIFEFRSKLK
ncbi:MAG: GNAT family N-acetyltransferase [Oligoflexia bacterium]|nr:GNAT family N-acetyltransferase [Oligoflexia bacterium]